MFSVVSAQPVLVHMKDPNLWKLLDGDVCPGIYTLHENGTLFIYPIYLVKRWAFVTF